MLNQKSRIEQAKRDATISYFLLFLGVLLIMAINISLMSFNSMDKDGTGFLFVLGVYLIIGFYINVIYNPYTILKKKYRSFKVRLTKMGSDQSPAGYIIGVVVALFFTAYTLPKAIVALTNETNWAGAPTEVIAIGTTVLAILVILGIAIKFMPSEIKSKVGM